MIPKNAQSHATEMAAPSFLLEKTFKYTVSADRKSHLNNFHCFVARLHYL